MNIEDFISEFNFAVSIYDRALLQAGVVVSDTSDNAHTRRLELALQAAAEKFVDSNMDIDTLARAIVGFHRGDYKQRQELLKALAQDFIKANK